MDSGSALPFIPSAGRSNSEPSGGKVPSSSRTRRGPQPQSCLECRRAKLKCNRTSPCSSCLKRGLADRCTGASSADVGGDATGLLLSAATSTIRELQDRNSQLDRHIGQLRQAVLDALKGDKGVYEPSHPLHEELMRLKHANNINNCMSKNELNTVSVNSFGTLVLDPKKDAGYSTYLGSTASSELFLEVSDSRAAVKAARIVPSARELPMEVIILGRICSFTSNPVERSSSVRAGLRSILPERSQVLTLCENFFLYATWFSSPFPRAEFMTEIFEPLTKAQSWDGDTFDKIALLFLVMSIGALFDFNTEERHTLAYRFFKTGSGTLGMSEFMESPSVMVVQALVVVCMFHLLSDDPDGPARCWATTGTLIRIAQAIGLNRDMSSLNMHSTELQRRRRLFWEVVFLDHTQAIFYGRPSGICSSHFDCPLPEAVTDEPTFMIDKYVFTKECLEVFIQEALTTKPPTYATVFKLDKVLRDWKAPAIPVLQGLPTPTAMSLALQSFALHGLKETTILHLHRSAFIEALTDKQKDPFRHKFAPSVVAVHQSCIVVIENMRNLLAQYPTVAPRVFVYSLQAFSAGVLLAALVTHAPGCTLSPAALLALEVACEVCGKTSDCLRMGSALPILRKFYTVARDSYATFHSGRQGQPGEQEITELTKLVGNTRLVAGERPPPPSTNEPTGDTPESQRGSNPTPRTQGDLVEAMTNGHPLGWMGFPASPDAPTVPSKSDIDELLTALPPQPQPVGDVDWFAFESIPGLEPNQLPLPVDGINFNWNFPADADDPLAYLTTRTGGTPGSTTWDYQ